MADGALPRAASDAVAREVVRIYERYAVEVVERFDLCPWAAGARRTGAVRTWVTTRDDPEDFSESLDAIQALAGEPRVTVALLVYPCFGLGRRDFEHFVRRLRRADAERHGIGEIPFAMAAFHPHAAPDLDAPERLVPFVRRSPDPTLQLVRQQALEPARGAAPAGTAFADTWMMSPSALGSSPAPSVRDRIAENNLETVHRVGPGALEAIFAEIERDRVATYARLGLPHAHRGD